MKKQAKEFLKEAKDAFGSHNWEKLNNLLVNYLETQENATEQEQEEALGLAIAVLVESDFTQRWEVTKVLKAFGDIAIEPLINIAVEEDYSSEIRWFATRILSEFKGEKVILTLVKLLETTEEEIAQAAAEGLANLGGDSIEVFTKLLQQPLNRQKIVQALGQISDPEVIEPLLSVVDDDIPEIRRQTLSVLGNYQDAKISEALVRSLKDTSAIVRKEALINLPRQKEFVSEAYLVSRIKPLLYDLNPGVCIQAANSLGRLGTEEAAEALFAVVESAATPMSLKINLVKSFLLIETKESLFYLERLLYSSETELLKEIILILGRFEPPSLKVKASEILSDFFAYKPIKLDDDGLKETLATSLGQLGQRKAIAILEKLMNNPQLRVRLHAQAAIKKLEALDL